MRHECCAEISISALRDNANTVVEKMPHARVVAVVKADAYGHGVEAVARALEKHVDMFAVAYLQEALALKQITAVPILILEGFFDHHEMELAAKSGIACVVHSSYQIKLLDQFPQGRKMDLWLKADTGMNRLGFSKAEFELICTRSLGKIRPRTLTLMSHLSSADELESPITQLQVDRFNCLLDSLGKYGKSASPIHVSLANSAAILKWPGATRSDLEQWIRPGIMLYGCSPFENTTGQEEGLQPVMTLRSCIIALRDVQVGETVGYGARWRAERPSRIGVVAIGYGDGYPRHAKTGTPVLINGHRVELVGRVSMDMITVDLTDLEGVKIGDPAILWGKGLPAEEVAKWADTISYELLTGITSRVARQVVNE